MDSTGKGKGIKTENLEKIDGDGPQSPAQKA